MLDLWALLLSARTDLVRFGQLPAWKAIQLSGAKHSSLFFSGWVALRAGIQSSASSWVFWCFIRNYIGSLKIQWQKFVYLILVCPSSSSGMMSKILEDRKTLRTKCKLQFLKFHEIQYDWFLRISAVCQERSCAFWARGCVKSNSIKWCEALSSVFLGSGGPPGRNPKFYEFVGILMFHGKLNRQFKDLVTEIRLSQGFAN